MKKQLMSIMVIGIAALFLGAGTFAYFSDIETSEGNTFTAGTLDLQLSNDGTNYHDGVTETWTISDWAPGDESCATLYATNVGSVDILEMTIHFDTVNNGAGDGSELDEKIIVTSWVEYFKNADGTWSGPHEYITYLEQWVKPDGVAPVTLKELDEMTQWNGIPGLDCAVTQDTESGDGILLRGGDHKDWKLEICFKFDETAENEYQGDSCVMTATLTGTQTKILFP